MTPPRPPHQPLNHSLWSADHQVSLVGAIGQAEPRLRQPAGRVDADMSPLVSRHGIKDVENSLGGGGEEEGRKENERRNNLLLRITKSREKQSPFYGLKQAKYREERRWLGWEWVTPTTNLRTWGSRGEERARTLSRNNRGKRGLFCMKLSVLSLQPCSTAHITALRQLHGKPHSELSSPGSTAPNCPLTR